MNLIIFNIFNNYKYVKKNIKVNLVHSNNIKYVLIIINMLKNIRVNLTNYKNILKRRY